MSDWTDEVRDRLLAPSTVSGTWGAPEDGPWCVKREADIRAALEEIERRGRALDMYEREVQGSRSEMAGRRAAEHQCAELTKALAAYEAQVSGLEAKLAEAERIVGLQNAALDVWKGAYPSDDSIHLAALAVAQGDRRLRVALEQIDRETRSASDVGLLRMGSIARAALRGER